MSGARHDTIAHGNKTPLNHVVNSSPNLELHFARCFESGERGPAVNRVDFCPVSIRIWVGKTSGTMLARIDKFLITELCQVHEYCTSYKNNFCCEPILEKYSFSMLSFVLRLKCQHVAKPKSAPKSHNEIFSLKCDNGNISQVI